MDLDRLALDEGRLEGLDAEPMQRRRAVQQHRVLLDDLLQDVPDLGVHLVDVPLGGLDVLDDLPLDEPAHDERLEELERHELRQAALVQAQVRAGHDHRAAGVVDALTEQVLAEAPLLPLEHVGERLQRPVARAGDCAAAAPVVEQGVDGLLQHPLLVVDDDLRRAEIQQSLEAVVPVDDAAIEVVEVGRGEAAAVELHHRPQLRRDDGNGLEDHPLGPVLACRESADDLEPLDRPLLLLPLRRADRLAQHRGLGVEVEVLEQLADRLRSHAAREVDAEPVRRAETVLELAEDLLVVDDQLRLELAEQTPGLLEPVDRVDGRLAGVLPPRLDVEVHLAHLEGPLHDRVEILLLDPAVGAQAEVVRQLADVGLLGAVEHLPQEAVAEVARLLEVLLVDGLGDRCVLLVQLGAGEKPLHDAMDVLGDRALLRAGRLLGLLLERLDGRLDLLGGGGDDLELARGQAPVVANRGVTDELADLLRVLRRDLRDELDEEPADEAPGILERRQSLLLGPRGEAPAPEVVVLVEVPFLALREVVAPARQPVLERGERLVAVDVDALGLGPHLVLEPVQVGGALLVVDVRDDRGGEVEHLLELARRDVEEVADAARNALEEPDVRDGRREVDVPHPLAPHLLPRHLDAAALADDALVADALVLAAVALPVLRRPEDALAEQAVALGLQRAVVDRLRLRDLARRPVADLLRRRETDADRVELIDVDQVLSRLLSLCLVVVSQSSMSRSTSSAAPTGSTSSSAGPSSIPSRSSSDSSAGSASSPSWSTRSWPSSTSCGVGCRAAARSEPGERSMPSSSAARSSSSSSSRTSTSPPSSEITPTSSASDCISLSSTLNDSGIDGSAMFSPLTIASYAFTRPTVSSDLIVSISCSVYAAP